MALNFCTEADIERYLQQAIDGDTKPNSVEASAFADTRASILITLCARWGMTVTPSTVTGALADLLRDANAIGAALDYTVAQQFGRSPSLSERAERLQILWTQYVGGFLNGEEIIGFIETSVDTSSSLATDHIISGDTAPDPGASVQGTNTPIGVGMRDEF